MLHLSTPSHSELGRYSDSVLHKIRRRLNNSALNDNAKAFLTDAKLRKILTDTPDNLLRHHVALMPLVVENFNEVEYDQYFKIKATSLAGRTPADTALILRYGEVQELHSVFDYKGIIVTSKKTSYDLAKKLNRNTCTYCNRSYTITVSLIDPDTNRPNDDGRLTRPQFDHWYAKSIFPVLCLSYFNLIPSCYICNSSIKGDEVFSLDTHIHPYMDKVLSNFKFSFNYKDVYENKVKINALVDSKIDKTLKAFKIQEVYDAHSNMELRDLLDLKFKYPEDYIKTLFDKTFAAMDVDDSETHRLVFGIESDEENFHKRPFSKFKKDILDELKLIDRDLI